MVSLRTLESPTASSVVKIDQIHGIESNRFQVVLQKQQLSHIFRQQTRSVSICDVSGRFKLSLTRNRADRWR